MANIVQSLTIARQACLHFEAVAALSAIVCLETVVAATAAAACSLASVVVPESIPTDDLLIERDAAVVDDVSDGDRIVVASSSKGAMYVGPGYTVEGPQGG